MKFDNRLALLTTFEDAPSSALFNQKIVAALFDCSLAKLERDRWEGVGLPYLKLRKAVRYRKSDITEYLKKQEKMQGGYDESR